MSHIERKDASLEDSTESPDLNFVRKLLQWFAGEVPGIDTNLSIKPIPGSENLWQIAELSDGRAMLIEWPDTEEKIHFCLLGAVPEYEKSKKGAIETVAKGLAPSLKEWVKKEMSFLPGMTSVLRTVPGNTDGDARLTDEFMALVISNFESKFDQMKLGQIVNAELDKLGERRALLLDLKTTRGIQRLLGAVVRRALELCILEKGA